MCGDGTVVVAIVGASGSGKSELARLVAELLSRSSACAGEGGVVIVQSDRYWKTTLYRETMYEAVKQQMMRCEYNRDHPDHYDHELLVDDVRYISSRRAAEDVNGAWGRCELVDADHTEGRAPRGGKEMKAKRGSAIIIVEGILILEHDDLRNMASLKVFCDCDPDLVAERRLARDRASFTWKYGGEEGRLAYYEKFTKPGFYEFISPRKAEADVVVPNNPADGPLAQNDKVAKLVEEIRSLRERAERGGSAPR